MRFLLLPSYIVKASWSSSSLHSSSNPWTKHNSNNLYHQFISFKQYHIVPISLDYFTEGLCILKLTDLINCFEKNHFSLYKNQRDTCTSILDFSLSLLLESWDVAWAFPTGNTLFKASNAMDNRFWSNGLMWQPRAFPGDATHRWEAGMMECMASWKSWALILILATSIWSFSEDW